MNTETDTFQQVSLSIAESYEASFVPALFSGLARSLVDFVDVAPGDRVLDVATGTGIVARTAADRVGPHGSVNGIDLNQAMVTVARRIRPDVDWHVGDAQTMPFPDRAFDVVTCQSGLMFIPDTPAALREMARVLSVDGRVGVQLWSSLDRQIGFRELAAVVSAHAGPEAVNLISTYFRHGDPDAFGRLCVSAGLDVTSVRTMPVTLQAPSIDDYVTTEVESTPLVAQLSAEAYGRIRAGARIALAPFTDATGALALPFEVYLVTARLAQ